MATIEDILMRYTLSPDGANIFPFCFSVTPDDIAKSVVTWAKATNQTGVDLEHGDLVEVLNEHYHRFLPAWLRVSELARRIFNELENFKEPQFNVQELTMRQDEALPCLERFLGNQDRYELQKFSAPEVLVNNAIGVQNSRMDPYHFDEVIELADKVNEILELNFISTCPDQTAEELTQYAKENWSHFRRSLPRWLRSVEDEANRTGASMADEYHLQRLIEASGEPIISGSNPMNQMAAKKGLMSLAGDIPQLQK